MAGLWRDFCIREARTGQQVAQLHDRYMMMIMMDHGVTVTFKACHLHQTFMEMVRILDSSEKTIKHY